METMLTLEKIRELRESVEQMPPADWFSELHGYFGAPDEVTTSVLGRDRGNLVALCRAAPELLEWAEEAYEFLQALTQLPQAPGIDKELARLLGRKPKEARPRPKRAPSSSRQPCASIHRLLASTSHWFGKK